MINFKEHQPNQLLVHPQLPAQDLQVLRELQNKFENEFGTVGFFLVPSSGSSQNEGESMKLIALSRQAVLNSADRVNIYAGASAEDTWGLFLPEYHVAGLGVFARASLTGSMVFQKKWSREQLRDLWATADMTLTSLVPTQVFDLVSQNIKAPPRLRKVFVGGGALSVELKEKALALGWPIVETYGMTETASMTAIREIGEKDFTAMDGVRYQADENQTLSVSCNSLLTAFVQKVNSEIILYQHKPDDFYMTQDRGQISIQNEKTHLQILGRTYEYIKITGMGVSLAHLQSVLAKLLLRHHLSPTAAAVWYAPDSRKENQLYLIKENSMSAELAEQLLTEFNQQVKPYERLLQVISVESLPRSELGKLKLSDLKSIIRTK